MIYPENVQRAINNNSDLCHAYNEHIFPGETNKTTRGMPPNDSEFVSWLVSFGSRRYSEVRQFLEFIEEMRQIAREVSLHMNYENPEASHIEGHDKTASGFTMAGLPIAIYLYYLKSHGVSGAVLECGCFKGGSTCVLSWACSYLGLKLIAADSFEGLPGSNPSNFYNKGDFKGSLEEVKRNVTRFGRIENVEFIKGWYADSLKEFDEELMLIWLDVDLRESTLDALGHTFNKLNENGVIFSDGLVENVHFSENKLIIANNYGLNDEAAGLIEFFKGQNIPYKAVPGGMPGIGLIVPNCQDNENLIFDPKSFKLLINISAKGLESQLQLQLQETLHEKAAIQEKLQQILDSNSWRLTQPIRSGVNHIRGFFSR